MGSTLTPLGPAIIGFVGVLLGFWWKRRSEAAAEARVRLDRENNARMVVYAQLRRIHATTRQQLEFISGPDRMIWLTIHRSLLPSSDLLRRLEPLTAAEVDAATSFYYLYQEQVSFLTASAMEAWDPDARCNKGAMFNLDTDVIAFDYDSEGRRDALVFRLTNINKSAGKALIPIRAVITARKKEFPSLHSLVKREAEKISFHQRPIT